MRMPLSIRRLACLVLALACFVPRVAAGQDDSDAGEARRLYGEAKKAMSAKKYREAALGFEAASKIMPHAVALYTAAQAWELAGESARAADAYALALRTPKLSDSQTDRSEERLKSLEKGLGVAQVKGKAGTLVALDDRLQAAVPARLHGTPGAHMLTVVSPDGSSDKRAVNLVSGKVSDVNLEEEAEPQPVMPEPKKPVKLSEPKKRPVHEEPSKPSSAWKTIGFVATGAGLAALGATALVGTSAKDAEDTYKAAPSQKTFDHAKGLQTRTNILLIGGSVLTASGIVILIWQSTKSEKHETALSVGVGPDQVFCGGQF